MNPDIFNKNNILFDTTSTNQTEAFQSIAKLAFKNGFISSEEEYVNGLIKREQESTTGFKDGIAIPHCLSDANLKSGLFLAKFANKIPWNALDNKPVEVAFALCIPKNGEKNHLKILSTIARKLMDANFINDILKASSEDELFNIINAIEIN